MKNVRYILMLMVAVMMAALPVHAQSLLEGKKWTDVCALANVGGTMQGAAYYDGKIYQFADAGAGHGIYDGSTWTAGGAISNGYLAACHFGSACFGPGATKNYTVNGEARTSQYPLLFVTGHDKTSGSRALLVNVIDYETKTLVASLRFQDTGTQDDMIAAYDFEGGKIYLMGYPGNVVGMAPWVIREYTGISFTSFTTTNRSITVSSTAYDVPSVDFTSATHTDVTIGGPNASGIQEDLVAGTLQDCHYDDGHIYFVVTRGSRYNRTEWVRVHDYDVSTKKVVKTVCSAINCEPEGFAFDGTNFYVTTGGDGIEGSKRLFKLAAGSGYDALNFQPAPLNGEYYEISTASQFVWFKQQVYSGCTTIKARLVADIDMSGQADPFTYYVYDEAATRTFDAQYAFRGEFDGNGHAISNVSITKTPHYNDGLFPYVMGANIHDLTVTGSLTATQSQDKKASTDNDVQNVGFIGKMNGGTLSNINLVGWSVTTGSGVSTSANVNQLIGAETGEITKTNILLTSPSSTTHSTAGGHVYINGFYSLSDASTSEDGYYETPEGDGTEGTPYLINNAGKLWWFAKYIDAKTNVSAHAKLTADINMEGSARGSFPGIGKYISGSDYSGAYKGTFDGQGHTISNFYINASGDRRGLFSYTIGATITNFNLSGEMIVTGGMKHGSVVGWADNGTTVSKIHSSVNVTATNTPTQIGGFAGNVDRSTISQCRYSGTVTSASAYNKLAGFAGVFAGGELVDCLFDGTLTLSVSNSGLIAGGMTSCSIDRADNAITNCLMNGTINISNPTARCGVIIGLISKYSFTCTNTYYNSTIVSSGLKTDNPDLENNGSTAPDWSMSITAVDPTATGFLWGNVKNWLNNGSTNWGINGDKAAYPLPNEVDKDATPVVKWTITFKDWDNSEIWSGQVIAGKEITKPDDPTRDGYKFDGWTTNGTDIVDWPQYANETMTFTAVYSVFTTTYTNGFKDGGQKTDVDYYEEPKLITSARCTELGIDASYNTNGYYEVKNAGNMFWIAKNFSSIENNRKFVMTADIDMEGTNHTDWAGIGAWGSTDTHFKGTFDGLGHKFTNYYMNITTGSWKAMFSVPNGATIKNFTISGNIDISSTGTQFGVLGGRIAGTTTFEDIHSAVNITVAAGKTPASIGGLVGQCSAQTSFNRCRYSGTITGNSAYKNLGGIFGNAEAAVTVNNCLFDGSISSTSTVTGDGKDNAIQIGGIGGRNNNKTTITNSLVNGTISVAAGSEALDAEKTHTGIVFGYQYTNADLTISNTYYKSISGLRAVGLNSATNQSKTDPTELVETPDWAAIKTALNNGSTNWGINSQVYPVPGETDGVQKYTITFSTDGSACASVTDAVGTVISLPTTSKSGYTFTGWNTKEDGSGDSYTGGASYTITADATLYAQWTAEVGGDYENGFHKTHAKTEADYYEEPVALTEERCAALGIDTSYAGYYEVKNAGNMFWIAKNLSADNNTRKYVVTADIDMEGNKAEHNDWAGIGAWSSPLFSGTFDGNGHAITNYYMNITSGSIKGMFAATTGNDVIIKNFSISGNMDISATSNQYGVIVGRLGGKTTLEDIHSSVNITVAAGKTPSSIGGLVGQVSEVSTFNRCRYSGMIDAKSAYGCIGGMFGNSENHTTLNNCLFDGSISSTSTETSSADNGGIRIGGLGGQLCNSRNLTITNSMSNGTISVATEAIGKSGIVFGDNCTGGKLTISNTYYSTANCSGLNAVGLNKATTTTDASGNQLVDPTAITTQAWTSIRYNLGQDNWKFEEGDGAKDYPVPGTGGPAMEVVKIIFETNGGSAVTTIAQLPGTDVTAPADPTKTGYTFGGWIDAEGNATSVPTTMPSTDLTLYAKWNIAQFTITFDLNGGTSAAIDPITQNYGTAITKPADPTREDWDFNGWSPAVPSTMPGENMTCVAQWVQETYNNGFNTNASCAANVKYQRPAGSGTAGDPYLIDNGGKLWWFATQVKAGNQTLCAKLTDDIDTECNTRVTNNSTNMPQMGGEITTPYTGTFDGNGFTISNWKQIWSGFRSGMFGYTTNATIKNFTLEGEMTVSGSAQQMAPVVGNAGAGTTIEDIWSKVDIAANGTVFIVGGVAGRQAGTLNRCRYSGKITCADGVFNGIGGIVGETYGGLTNNCLFDGTIIAPSSNATLRVGGIVGTQSEAAASTIKNCFANGTITLANYSTETSGVVMGGNTNQQYVYNMYYTRTNVSASLKRAAGISTKSAMGHCEDVTGKATITDGTLVNMLGNGNWKQDETAGYPVPFKGTATAGLDANGFSYAKDGTHDAVTQNGEWYEIANGGQLLDFAEKIAAGTIAGNSKAKLTADIDLEWCDFPGIGYYTDGSNFKKFQGTFDGQGHTVRGMYRNVVGAVQRKGMFNCVENATIKNFTVEGEIQVHEGNNSTYFIGGVVGIGDTAGTLEDVTSSVDINVIKGGETTRIIGGVAGRFKGTMNRCRYNGTIDLGTNTAQQVGGVLASAEVTTMSNCLFDGTIVAATSNAAADKVVIGGLLGIDNNAVTMKNCLSNGTITLSNASAVTTNVGAVWVQITKTTSSSTVTYYTTTGITKAGAAVDQVGGTNASSNMVTTAKGETSWADVNSALNNNSTYAGNWQIVSGQSYPIPSYFTHEHEYDQYGFCTLCGQPEPIGEPDAQGYYHIDHLADLGQFAELVNTSASGTVINAKMTADIDLTGHEITTQIGDASHHYCGTFDGQGHTIEGIDVETDSKYVGLFACVGITDTVAAKCVDGSVKNLSVKGKMKATHYCEWNKNQPLNMGVIGEIYNGTVENVHSSVDYVCTSGTRSHIGGVVGSTKKGGNDAGTIVVKNCSYDGEMTLNAVDCIGGIVGYMQHHAWVYNSLYAGTIKQEYTGPSQTDGTKLTDDSQKEYTYIGGILGYSNSGSNGVQSTLVVGDFSTNLTPETTNMNQYGVNMNIGVGFDGMLKNDKTPSKDNYVNNYIPESVTKYHQLPTDVFSSRINIRPDNDFANGSVCAELNEYETAESNPWGQILGYQVGYDVNGDGVLERENADGTKRYDPNSPAQRYPYPGYTDPEQTSYKVVRTANAGDASKYDYVAEYYFFDDYGDRTPYPGDAASVKVKRIRYTRVDDNMAGNKFMGLEGYNSMCLPFDFTEEMAPAGAKFYVYQEYSEAQKKVHFSEVTEFPIAAGTPFIMKCDGSTDWTQTIEKDAVTAVPLKVTNPASGEGLYGVFDTKKLGEGYWKLKGDGSKLVKTTAASYCYPYRCYFRLPSSGSVKEYQALFDADEVYDIQLDEAAPQGAVYNTLGQRVSKNARGLVIVNGRKVVR